MSARHKGAKGRSPLIWLAAGVLTVVSMLTSCAIKAPAVVEGTWVITSAATPGISAMSAEQTKAWLGMSFQYSPDNVVLGQTQCGSSTWNEQSLSAKDFQREYRVSFEQLGIVSNRIKRFQVQCDGKSLPGQSVLVTSRNRAFTVWDGVFFQMEKAEAIPH